MKNNFDIYLEEVWMLKDMVADDFEKSDFLNFSDYLHDQMKGIKVNYRDNDRTNKEEEELKQLNVSVSL